MIDRTIILSFVFVFFTVHAELLSCNNGQACPSPFVCQNGTCRYQQPVPCEDNGACPPGLFCYGLLPSCSPPPNPLACDQDGKCPLGFGCFQGICASQPLSPCGANNVCNQGFSCNNGSCVPVKTCPIPPTPVAGPGCNIITTWNEQTGCPTSECKTCPNNSMFTTCANLCPPKTCGNHKQFFPCFSLRCGGVRCQCNYNYVQLTNNIEQGCVKIEECP
ncbi:hypothetical protein V3C99_002818 [Haemonchus contortus]|uniref:CC domain-containing protein n=1 Tax=Haemonchus contortus TaxID=6289 RepID=A0A7I4Y9X9_HAECO